MAYADASLRATSLAASAALLAVAAIAALTATFSSVVFDAPTQDTPPILSIVPVTESPPAPRPDQPIIRQSVIEEAPQTISNELPPLTDFTETVDAGTVGGAGVEPANISNPYWTAVPRNLERYYPRRAAAREIEGQAVLDCRVLTTGALDCAVVSETPANWGFAQAALEISRAYRMTPATRNGVPVEGRYRMRVPFELN